MSDISSSNDLADPATGATSRTSSRKKPRLVLDEEQESSESQQQLRQSPHNRAPIDRTNQGTNHSSGNNSAAASTTVVVLSAHTAAATADAGMVASSTSRSPFSFLLNEIIVEHIFKKFLGPGHYRYVAGTSPLFRDLYTLSLQQQGNENQEQYAAGSSATTVTSGQSVVESVSRAELCWKERQDQASVSSTIRSSRRSEDTSLIRTFGELAAIHGNIDVLQWVMGKGCALDSLLSTCRVAARYGQLAVLQWARQNGCEWDWTTCSSAAENGHVEVLQWARQNGCEWNSETCTAAARKGHFEVL